MTREELLRAYTEKLELTTRLQNDLRTVNEQCRDAEKAKQEITRKSTAMATVGQKIAEVANVLGNSRYIVEQGHRRLVVGLKPLIDPASISPGTRVALDAATDTITFVLPRAVDPTVHHMAGEDPGDVSFSDVGGLGNQLNEIREIVELPLLNPGIFARVGIKPASGALLYGPPGTGKTLIARVIAKNTKATFLKVVATNFLGGWLGDSERLVRELFHYAKAHQPALIFIDEIDAIGMRRASNGSGTDRQTQRTLTELLAQMDGFGSSAQVKVLMATNRPDVLDPALLRPGRLDRKIEIPLPNEQSRSEILKIHSKGLSIEGDVDWDAVVKLSEGFNGADLRNICTEAGLLALRAERDAVINEDFLKAVRQLKYGKNIESAIQYDKV
jgi:26S proteasome regulatory subunit T4